MNEILDYGLKLVFLQVRPGKELDVASQFKIHLSENIYSKFSLLKGFGFWDLIAFYRCRDFSHGMTPAGPIEGILNSLTYLCYPLKDSRYDEESINFSSLPYVGFVHVKLDHNAINGRSVQLLFENILKFSTESVWYKFGTVGWSDLVLICCAKSIDIVAKEIGKINTELEDSYSGLILKTHSQFGFNYDYMPNQETFDNGYPATLHFLNEKIPTRCLLGDDLSVEIKISSKPSCFGRIAQYWTENQEYFVKSTFGNFDLKVFNSEKISWNSFLSRLLYFRYCFSGDLLDTMTEICISDHGGKIFVGSCDKDHDLSNGYYDFDYSAIVGVFGETLAPILANHFYSINGLSQHPLTGDVYKRITNYLGVVVDKALKIKEVDDYSNTVESFAITTSRIISAGSKLRSYGLPENTQKSFFSFSKLTGGVLKAIEAIEALPKYIFKSFNSNWRGFIITQDPKYSHFNNVIMIPTEALWSPSMWWAIYHEIAHLMIDSSDLFSISDSVVLNFLDDKAESSQRQWIKLLEEVLAEIIGFELGFFKNFDLFLELLWEHLKSIDPMLDIRTDLHQYVFRSMALMLFNERFNKRSITDEEFDDDIFVYNKLLVLIDKIDKIMNRASNNKNSSFPDKKIFAAINAKTLRELLPIFKKLHRKIRGLAPAAKGLTSVNTQKVFNDISSGKIYWGGISSPEAVLYKVFLERKNMTFRSNIATIITYWNFSLKLEGEKI